LNLLEASRRIERLEEEIEKLDDRLVRLEETLSSVKMILQNWSINKRVREERPQA
jgi:prefoldin subunit 5